MSCFSSEGDARSVLADRPRLNHQERRAKDLSNLVKTVLRFNHFTSTARLFTGLFSSFVSL